MGRGSKWRCWDLHIHTPYTKLNNNYCVDKEGYKKTAEIDLSNDKSINSGKIWKTYCEYLNKSEVQCFGITDYFSVDNFEFLSKNREKFGLDKDIVLFPNIELRISGLIPKAKDTAHKHVNVHIIFPSDMEIIKIKRFLSNLTVQGIHGETLDFLNDFDELKNGEMFSSIPDVKTLKDALKNTFGEHYKNKVLIMVPNGGDGLSPKEGTGYNTNFNFMQSDVDIIQSANYADRNFYLEQAPKYFKKQFPCITGSDAHDFETINRYSLNKKTWIKADPTFEGLKSIVYEPKYRVKIQKENPSKMKRVNKIISHIEMPTDETFNSQKIYFNQDLNVIIGGRSSGKSLLLSLIANKAHNIKNVKGENEEYNRLIRELSQDTQLYVNENEEITGDMIIEFFHQDKLQEIARNVDKRNDFIIDTLGKDDTVLDIEQNIESQISNLNFDNIVVNKQKLNEIITDLGRIQTLNKIQENISSYETLIKKNQIEFDDDESINLDKTIEELNSLSEQNKMFESKKNKLNKLIKEKLFILNENLIEDLDIIEEVFPVFQEKLDELNKEFKEKMIQSKAELSTKKESIENRIKELASDNLYKKYLESIKSSPEIEEYSKRLESEKKILQERKEFEKEKKIIEEKLSNSVNVFMSHFNWENYEREKNIVENNQLKITYRTSIDKKFVAEIFKGTFKCGQNVYKDIVTGGFKEIINDNFSIDRLNDSDFYKSMEQILFSKDTDFYKMNSSLQTFLSSLISDKLVKKDFLISYEEQDFKTMSEGKQAFVLLLIKLQFGDKDCPFLIDQPEDNLDNRSIVSDLVKYIKREKLKRQIFIVTHNANIVVGADSENVIIANEHDEYNPNPNGVKFYYKNGSLENLDIKSEVCEILEGGQIAFKSRENRYNFESII